MNIMQNYLYSLHYKEILLLAYRNQYVGVIIYFKLNLAIICTYVYISL